MADGSPVGRRVVLGMLGLGAIGVVAGRPLTDATPKLLGAVASKTPPA